MKQNFENTLIFSESSVDKVVEIMNNTTFKKGNSNTRIFKIDRDSYMELKKVKPMWFDSFYVSLLSEKYKNGKMSFVKGFFVGFISNVSGMFKKEFSSHIYIIKNK